VNKGEEVKVVMRFEGYRGKYLIYCHNLEHEDHCMMARYDVTQPKQARLGQPRVSAPGHILNHRRISDCRFSNFGFRFSIFEFPISKFYFRLPFGDGGCGHKSAIADRAADVN
jgi:hypothetical protein